MTPADQCFGSSQAAIQQVDLGLIEQLEFLPFDSERELCLQRQPRLQPLPDLALEPRINSSGIVEWGVKNIIPVVLLFIGIGIIAGARKGQMSQNAMTITNVLLGCVVIAGAALFYGFADNLAGFVFHG